MSVITAWNSHRDKINDLGSARFARESGQQLQHFYSVDTYNDKDIEKGNGARKGKRGKNTSPEKGRVRRDNVIPLRKQRRLWSLPHASTHPLPGTLSICMGLPVMIKTNEATECGVTNGAEGVIVGWKARPIADDKYALETVFVKLTSPPEPVHLDGLPENVVPVSHQTVKLSCELPNGEVLKINRSQVPIVPNFAMTDYASQGRTRPNNVCDLLNCKGHTSVYTCLSRGSTYEGTIVLQGFNAKQFSGGLSGHMRQEFRELEMLDHITKLKYNKKLPGGVEGDTRRALIYSFRSVKGSKYMPKEIHTALKWSDNSPFEMKEPEPEAKWEILASPNKLEESKPKAESKMTHKKEPRGHDFVPAKGTKTLQTVSNDPGAKRVPKRKRDPDDMPDVTTVVKRTKIVINTAPAPQRAPSPDWSLTSPRGFIWDGNSYSCAYDALFCILLHIYRSDPRQWNKTMTPLNAHLSSFAELFDSSSDNSRNPERARDRLRQQLHAINPHFFPMVGRDGTDLYELCREFLGRHDGHITKTLLCAHCGSVDRSVSDDIVLWDCSASVWKESPLRLGSYHNRTVSEWLNPLLFRKSSERCNQCGKHLTWHFTFKSPPTLMTFAVYDMNVNVEHDIKLPGDLSYTLRGIIYFGAFHFTCRVFTASGEQWFNDGITTGAASVPEGQVREFDVSDLGHAHGRKMSVLIYAKS